YTQFDLAHIFELDVTLQHLDASGAPLLPGNGDVLSGAPLDQAVPEMISDGAGGCVVWWQDHRALDPDVYAQRRDATGHDRWVTNGTPVYLSPGTPRIQSLVGDGAGGVIVAYMQKKGANYDLFARRFDGAGTPLWTARPVCVAPELQGFPQMLPDGAGGAFILWIDLRGRHEALYIQRIDANGGALWSPDGVLVKDTPDWLETLSMIPDGAGGVIVPFRQLKDVPGGPFDLWVQRFGPDGARRWGDSGHPLSQISGDVPWHPVGVPDGQGGALIAWEDWYPGDRMFAQRMDSTGTPRWVLDGRLVESTHQSLTLPAIASDDAGGAFLAWADNRAGGADSPDVYAQHLDANGLPVWLATGAPISVGPGRQMAPLLLADGSGGAFVSWLDDHDGGGADFVAQRLHADGTPQWTGGPRAMVAQPGVQEAGSIVPDGAGGIIASWQDARGGAGSLDIYAQRMNGAGVAQWTADGIPVCTAPSLQRLPLLTPDGTGGVFLLWDDARDGLTNQIYLQHLNGSGDTLFVRDGITEVVSSLARAEASFDGIRLMWQVRGDVPAFDLERRTDGPWERVARSSADGSGMVAFEDHGVIAGGRYGYRLGWDASDGRHVSGEVWLQVPSHAALALSALDPNPTSGPIGVVFTLPRAGTATIEVLDVFGRRVERRVLTTLEVGSHRVTLATNRRLPGGLYLIRLSQDDASVTRKVCVLR
ncbi:MAG: T9SS type A sorting domain-containing protein, partial [Candidatus Eisenbacteria bacterium]